MNLFFGFSGRMGRAGWWFCQLVCTVMAVTAVALLAQEHGLEFSDAWAERKVLVSGLQESPWVVGLVLLGACINLASTVKRFHDMNKSGAWILAWILINIVSSLAHFDGIRFLGGIWILIECGFLAGTPGANSYGDPVGATPSIAY